MKLQLDLDKNEVEIISSDISFTDLEKLSNIIKDVFDDPSKVSIVKSKNKALSELVSDPNKTKLNRGLYYTDLNQSKLNRGIYYNEPPTCEPNWFNPTNPILSTDVNNSINGTGKSLGNDFNQNESSIKVGKRLI